MSSIHRNGDSRSCGASTVVVGQSFVYDNGRLVSVDGDPNTHGGGGLNASSHATINGKRIVKVGDGSAPDLAPHPSSSAVSGSSTTFSE